MAGRVHLPFCSSCGAKVDSSLFFCPSCGTKLKAARDPSPATKQISMKEKGGELEDSVAGYFRSKGYDVQIRTKMRDRRDVYHEIDVLAAKREDFGIIQIAVECKNVRSRIDIKEIRNFNDKLSALGITKGIFVSTGGFTTDAEADAASVNIELWDEKALEEKISRQETPERDIIHDALPVNPDSIDMIAPKHLKNYSVFSESKELDFRPYYFLDYHCFSQFTVRGDSTIMESKGTLTIDAVDGRVVDSATSAGQEADLPSHGAYAGCRGMQTQTVTAASLPHDLPVSTSRARIDSGRAKAIAKVELVKGLSSEYSYHVSSGVRIARIPIPTTRSKLLNPKKKDVEILNVEPVKIPLLTGTYKFRNFAYTRTCLASTGELMLDQTSKCQLCSDRPVVVCENCGAIACESHTRTCSICSKPLCTSCATSKGIISKTFYCQEHKPQK